ncbi:hypothetical protein DPMN_097907 [Dreissena polymorpha]|uniref:Uncharacterized protein n=1 Tax=Dreissena polymorpha TaxID=45954 RepID=A0A9D4LC15_DREPO|nr:hypothetical protein DPMN_097907 [Dreissena polymorpha]
MYGAEYETQCSPVLNHLHDRDVPCAVCFVRLKTTLMIPGRVSCFSCWTKEYRGYLMAEYEKLHGKGYVCIDKHPESRDAGFSNGNGALFYLTESRCGSLRCPPYSRATLRRLFNNLIDMSVIHEAIKYGMHIYRA